MIPPDTSTLPNTPASLSSTQIELLTLWLEGALSDSLAQEQFAQWCREDAEFSAYVKQVQALQALAADYPEAVVPQWDRSSTLPASVQQVSRESWGERLVAKVIGWKRLGWNGFAVGVSLLAMVMVTLNVQVRFDAQGLLITTAQPLTSQAVEDLITTRLAEYQQVQSQEQAQQQAQQWQRFVAQWQTQQQQFNAQLSQYVLTTNRQQRKADFAELIQFVNQQRLDDQVFYARELQQLQQAVSRQHRLPSIVPSQWQKLLELDD